MERDALTAARRLSLWQYVKRRNGRPAGARGSLTAMLRRSLGAPSLAGFWRHWNPIWSYGLSRYVDAPLRRIVPPSLALVLTFAVSGLIHDAVIMALRGAPAFIFTPWFVAVALLLLLFEWRRWRFDGWSWPARAAINLLALGGALLVSRLAMTVLTG